MATTPDTGIGTTITFTGSTAFIANVTSITWEGISRAALETTHLASGAWRTYMPGDLLEPGNLAIEMHFEAANSPPITATANTVTINFPGGGTTNDWSATGFLTDFSVSAESDGGIQLASANLKLTGAVTF